MFPVAQRHLRGHYLLSRYGRQVLRAIRSTVVSAGRMYHLRARFPAWMPSFETPKTVLALAGCFSPLKKSGMLGLTFEPGDHPNQALERTADRREDLLSMTSTLKREAKSALVSGRSAWSRESYATRARVSADSSDGCRDCSGGAPLGRSLDIQSRNAHVFRQPR